MDSFDFDADSSFDLNLLLVDIEQFELVVMLVVVSDRILGQYQIAILVRSA